LKEGNFQLKSFSNSDKQVNLSGKNLNFCERN